ncbi:hypothetical protein ECZC10_53750 [Escherichia coli]|nr:hypothetical protein ECZC10_53750 [Escherichia coli]
MIHFGDAQAALIFDKTLPVNSPSGMSDSGTDSVWALNVEHRVVESRVITNDYNHREAQNILMSVPADMTRGEGYDTSYGEVYHYRPRHTERGDKIDPAPETANFWAGSITSVFWLSKHVSQVKAPMPVCYRHRC